MRISHLLNMLNNDDKDVRELARSSLFLDLRNPSGKLDSHSVGFGVWSDWLDLKDLCVRTGVSLEWVRSDTENVRVLEDIIKDPLTKVRATATYGGYGYPLTSESARRTLLELHQYCEKQHWTGLKLQGKLACLSSADHSVSHSFLKNTALSEDIVIFTVKARLQVLTYKTQPFYLVSTTQVPHCLHHTKEQITETLPHILNGCHAYKGMYIARHDRIVKLIVKDISNVLTVILTVIFSHLSANTPDVVVINEERREVFILEVACTFDSSMEEAFMTKFIKYQQLLNIITEIGYQGRLSVFIFGSLGHIHRLVVRGLQQLGMPKKRAKQLCTCLLS
ncbi:Retrovirus-related Pol polyprotein from type-2 retrotransposable element R2DM [Labeo rohita]|uniref:Retrovirus-related Pol polyprotein from type-2 retrotransposable element R2DM n=1 Tax=Labeo rohita TaxID=84645 RepID=A0ABQ8LQU0_LABRO|nr:Retrovirus-related Pol polyprotein from type-2 retrotransposable element R2DM [Labeo rohita]